MTTLTADQTEALQKFEQFLRQPDATAFLLEGGAGVGKTFLVGQFLTDSRGGRVCVATPTHKATNVVRRKLDGFDVQWVRGYDAFSYAGEVVTGTTAQLLGIGPVITEEQGKEVKFGKGGKGILSKWTPDLLVIDEVSMLGQGDFLDLVKHGKRSGMKILAVGDAGQLPPVKQEQIPFDKFKNKAQLRQIVRQAAGSAIVEVAWAIRDGQPWRDITGRGVTHAENVGAAFLDAVQVPGERPEEQREVYIAYRNATVDRAQEMACQKLYGHGRLAFAPGELVLSETNLYRGKVLLCANQDELVVVEFHDDEKDATTGTPVTLRHRRGGVNNAGTFRSSYLSPEELANKEHPYNAELRKREQLAQKLQQDYNAMNRADVRRSKLDAERRQAWQNFFSWRDSTIISFRHPFAITSHKSQGSTYRQVFVEVSDFAKFGTHGLYVAVTRPKDDLVVKV
jgi:hypothetical protein